MKKFLPFFLLFLLCTNVFAEQDVHKDLDRKLLTLRLGTSFEKIQVLKYLGAFNDKETFIKRGLYEKICAILNNKAENPRVRAASADAIRNLVDIRIVERYSASKILPPFIQNADENLLVRSACVRALGAYLRIFPKETRNELYKQTLQELLKLGSKQNALKLEALEILCNIGDAAAESALNKALSDPDLVDKAVTFLQKLLRSRGKIKQITIAIKLLDIFTNTNIAIPTRIKAGDSLCLLVKDGLTHTYPLEKVTKLLVNKETDPRLIPVACSILYTIQDRKSLQPIVERLGDEKLDDETRIAMINILGDFFGAVKPSSIAKGSVNKALSVFARFLRRDPANPGEYAASVEVRRVSAFAAGMVMAGFNRKGAVLILINSLDDADEEVRNIALEGLICITNQNFGTKPEIWREWFEENSDLIR